MKGRFILSCLPSIVLLILLSPILLPIILLVKVIDIVIQPYLYKKATKNWNLLYQENLKKGICIDYPPEYGKVSIMDLWNFPHKFFEEDNNDEDLI